ncbi:MAG: hypothetical protein M1839_000461 [Geoglossum umbratile]|nr:MAG: hypothetical protein M1839_000461 [Geoglossum umbratile]
MTSVQISLNEGCRAWFPEMSFSPHMSIEHVKKEWTQPLLVFALACERLRQDLKTLLECGPYSQKEIVTQFLFSTSHHIDILLMPTLAKLKGLLSYHDVRASDYYLDGNLPSIGDLLVLASESFENLHESWRKAIMFLGRKYVVLPGSVVPTASPRELLISLLVNRPTMLQKIATDIDSVLGKHLDLPFAPQINGKEFTLKKAIANGSPKMFFACYHIKNGNRELYIGANEADWTGLPAIGSIRREDLDYRLRSYISLATRAYNALKQAEEDVTLPASMANLAEKDKKYQVRLQAIASMKNPHHLDFLGRKAEIGQPFDKNMKSQQCCYIRKGTMGYKTPAEFKQKAIKKYLCHMDWKLRNGYAHSCAEVATSLQCGKNWVDNGKDIKH